MTAGRHGDLTVATGNAEESRQPRWRASPAAVPSRIQGDALFSAAAARSPACVLSGNNGKAHERSDGDSTNQMKKWVGISDKPEGGQSVHRPV